MQNRTLTIQTLGIEYFTKVTPSSLPTPLSSYSCSVATFQNILYFAIAYHEDEQDRWMLKIWRYQSQVNAWMDVYCEVLQNQVQLAAASLQTEARTTTVGKAQGNFGVKLNTVVQNNGEPPILTLSITSSASSKFLYSTDGEHYQAVSNYLSTNFVAIDQILVANNKIYALAAKDTHTDCRLSLLMAESFNSENWQEIDDQPIFADKNNLNFSSFIEFDQSLIVAVTNRKRGFQLWKYQSENLDTEAWELVIPNGAYRFAHNQKVEAIVTFDGNLYAMSSASVDVSKLPRDWYLNQYEITRFYPNYDWDVITGVPRFTPRGLRVPLSGLGPNFEMGRNSISQCFIAHGRYLYFGVSNEEGFQLWSSQNGEDWLLYPPNDMSNYYRAKAQAVLSTALGLLLVLEVMELNGDKHLEIWLAQ